MNNAVTHRLPGNACVLGMDRVSITILTSVFYDIDILPEVT